jgi:hypothetical protein
MSIANISRRYLMLGLGGGLAATRALGNAASAQPSAPSLTFVYEATVLLSPDVPHGTTPHGERFRAPIVGGYFQGPDLDGKVVPGGADWQLRRADGWFELDAGYFMETSDGTQIHVRNRGLWHSATGDWPADYAYTTPEFEAPNGRYDWLNQHVFIGTVGSSPGPAPAVIIRVWRVG